MKISNLKFKISNFKRGFTLVELLIVIAILGILAVGLMAALDPMEQLKKGRDTAVRNNVEEFYNAALRYNAVEGKYPWGSVNATGNLALASNNSNILSIVNAGEMKSQFTSNTVNLGKIYITSTHAGLDTNRDDLAVCFAPESKAVQMDDGSRYYQNGGVNTTCPTTGITCYWCIK